MAETSRLALAGLAAALALPLTASAADKPKQALNYYSGSVPAAALLRVPVTKNYPGGTTAGLNPELQNPHAKDPDAVQRGMRDFDTFNCSGCHAANGGGGMGPSLSNDTWLYTSSPGAIYLDIVQGRGEMGMPAFGAMLPDEVVWDLVAYVKSISEKPGQAFGKTTSLNPQSPSVEQVPAGQIQTATPWNYTQPMPKAGGKPPG
jgi:cytochrome c oxidase cbb3-type subunit 3